MKRTGERMKGQATDKEKIFEKITLYPEHRKLNPELYQKAFALKQEDNVRETEW